MCNDLGDALDLRELVVGLLQKRVVLDGNDVSVAQRIGIQTRERIRIVQGLDKVVERLIARDKGRGADIGDEVDLRADGFGLGLGIALVDVDEHLVFLLELLDHGAGIVEDEAERAHDDEARHRDADGREGHEAVQEHAAEAFAQ